MYLNIYFIFKIYFMYLYKNLYISKYMCMYLNINMVSYVRFRVSV
jgi:hypothetical protein